MSQPTATTATTASTGRRSRRLSRRARAGILGGTGLAAAVAATLVISGAAGASAAGDQTPIKPASIVEEGSGASDATGAAPASMVAEGSGASDAVGTTFTDPVTGVTVIDGDMLIAPEPQVVKDTSTGSGAAAGVASGEGAVPTDLHTVAPGGDAASSVERDVVTGQSAAAAQGPASIVAEGSGASDATNAGPDAGVQVIDGDMLIAPETTGTY